MGPHFNMASDPLIEDKLCFCPEEMSFEFALFVSWQLKVSKSVRELFGTLYVFREFEKYPLTNAKWRNKFPL